MQMIFRFAVAAAFLTHLLNIGLAFGAEQTSQETSAFHPFYNSINGKYGYLDNNGTVHIYPKFDLAWDFTEGLAPAQLGKLIGYINSRGDFVIAPKFRMAEQFSEGLALASEDGLRKDDLTYGYIDKSGQFVIAPRLQLTSRAECGTDDSSTVPAVSMLGGAHVPGDVEKGGCIQGVPRFSEGLAPFWQQDKWGFISTTGKVIIEPKYSIVTPFSEGFAAVAVERSGLTSRYYHIDYTGNYLNPEGMSFLGSFHEGLAAFENTDGKYGYISKSGKVAIPAQFAEAQTFREGLAAAARSFDRFGCINHRGEFVMTCSPEFPPADS
jgi:hypothetical protein